MEAGPSRLASRLGTGAMAGPGPSTTANKSKSRKKAAQKKKTASQPSSSSSMPPPGPPPSRSKRKPKQPGAQLSSASSSGDIVFLEQRSKAPPTSTRAKAKSHGKAKREAPPHMVAASSSPRGLPPPVSPQSASKKKAKTHKQRNRDRAQRMAVAKDELEEMDEINASFLDLDVDVSGDGPATVDALLASTSTRKGRRKSTNDVPLGEPLPSTVTVGDGAGGTPSSYKPMRRSIIAGLKLSPDPPSLPLSPPPTSSELPKRPSTPTHFDPPPAFSSSLPATLAATTADQPSNTAQTTGLLLPAHIVLDGMEDAPITEDGAGIGEDEGLFFLDEDTTKNVQRYFDPTLPSTDADPTFLNTADQSKICRKCKRPGHRSEQCPHLVCDLCGAMDEHEKAHCKFGIKCFKCGQRGHRREECGNAPMTGCSRCGSNRHIEFACPTHWRIYTYLSVTARAAAQDRRAGLVEWQKEAAGGAEWEAWCYNCAREGHFGDDCNMRRGSLVPLDNPSPFGDQIASRGPFASQNGMRGRSGSARDAQRGPGEGGSGSHMRFEDNLPDLQPAFAGLGAGQKGKAKSLAAQRHAERVAGMMEDDDDPVWVSGGGVPTARGGGARGSQIQTPSGMRHPLPARPWDSERRERTPQGEGRGSMPFSHGHLMSAGPPPRGGGSETHWSPRANGHSGRGGHAGKGISFGQISMPGDSPRTSAGTPTGRGGVGGAAKAGGGAAALVARALGSGPPSRNASGSGSPSSSRGASPLANGVAASGGGGKKKRKTGDRDDAWSNGNLGGNVAEWGREMDSAERLTKAPKRGPGSPAGLRIRGASAGEANGSSTANGGRGKGKSPRKGNGSVATAQRYYGAY